MSLIDVHVLAGIDDVESGGPEGHRKAEGPDWRDQFPRQCYPCADGGKSEAESEHEVAGPGESLRVGVKEEEENQGRPEEAADRFEVVDCEEQED